MKFSPVFFLSRKKKQFADVEECVQHLPKKNSTISVMMEYALILQLSSVISGGCSTMNFLKKSSYCGCFFPLVWQNESLKEQRKYFEKYVSILHRIFPKFTRVAEKIAISRYE